MDSIKRNFQYETWANRRILHAATATPTIDDRCRQILAHLFTAQRVWLTRLRGHDTAALAIWPTLTMEDCAALLEENERGYQQYLDTLTPTRLQEIVTHQTSTGLEFRLPVADILTQVLFHGAYHRGQVATAIRRAGGDPPMTEFILFARETPAS